MGRWWDEESSVINIDKDEERSSAKINIGTSKIFSACRTSLCTVRCSHLIFVDMDFVEVSSVYSEKMVPDVQLSAKMQHSKYSTFSHYFGGQ